MICGVLALVIMWFDTYDLIYPFTAKSAVALIAGVTLFIFVGLPMRSLRSDFRGWRDRTRDR